MSTPTTPKDPTTPPPVIGKIGPYTVFLTPPSPPPTTAAAVTTPSKNVAVHAPPPAPPVRPPPAQFHESSDDDRFGFLRDYLAKVQTWHESIDGFMANWLGLNQSKFQWALDDYYEANSMAKGDMTKEVPNKKQTV